MPQPGNPTLPDRPAVPAEVNGRSGRSSDEVRAALAQTEERLQASVQGLRRELTLQDIRLGDAPLLDHIRRNPWLAVGAAAGVLAAATLLAAGLRKRRQRGRSSDFDLRAYLEHAVEGAAVRIGASGDPEAEFRDALRRRAPIIYVESAGREDEGGGIKGALISVFKMGAGFGLKFAMDRLQQEFMNRPAPQNLPPPRS